MGEEYLRPEEADALKDISRDILRLEEDPVRNYNTIQRATAVRSLLISKDERKKLGGKIAKEYGTDYQTLYNWKVKYVKHRIEGKDKKTGKVKGLFSSNKVPLNYNPFSAEDKKEIYDKLKIDYKNLYEKNEFNDLSRDTKTRLNSIYLFAANIKNQTKIGNIYGISKSSIGNWARAYKKYGIEAIKKLHDQSVSQPKRSRDGDEGKAKELKEEFNTLFNKYIELKNANAPKHKAIKKQLKKIKPIIEYLENSNTSQKTVAEENSISKATLQNRVKEIDNEREKTSYNDKFKDVNSDENKKLKRRIREDFKNFEEVTQNASILRAIARYFSGNKTIQELADRLELEPKIVKEYIEVYKNGTIEALEKKIEARTNAQEKKDSLEDLVAKFTQPKLPTQKKGNKQRKRNVSDFNGNKVAAKKPKL